MLFFFFWLHWVLVAARGIFMEACRIFRCGAPALCFGTGASLWLWHAGSVVVARRLSSGARALERTGLVALRHMGS